MNTNTLHNILLSLLAVMILAGVPASIYLILACRGALRPHVYASRGIYGYYPQAPFGRGRSRGGEWRLNPMTAVHTPPSLFASLWMIQAPPTAFQQLGRYRRAGDAEAGFLLQEMLIGIGHVNGPSITLPGQLADDHSSRISSGAPNTQHVQ
ncbi:hypothetical protein FB451DRAFT_1262554 [Mycena latifolia]|nr:hypothetical protein FB451DRAFT_1262554 [Mycena latifolia]